MFGNTVAVTFQDQCNTEEDMDKLQLSVEDCATSTAEILVRSTPIGVAIWLAAVAKVKAWSDDKNATVSPRSCQ